MERGLFLGLFRKRRVVWEIFGGVIVLFGGSSNRELVLVLILR